MTGLFRPATGSPGPPTVRTVRRAEPAVDPASLLGRWRDRTSSQAPCGTCAGPRQREGGFRRDGRRCGHGGDARERGATDTPPSRSYDGMQNEMRLGDLVKVIWWDGQGACLFSKRLERGRFVWPSASGGKVTMTPAQLSMLLEGIDWRAPVRTWRPLSAG